MVWTSDQLTVATNLCKRILKNNTHQLTILKHNKIEGLLYIIRERLRQSKIEDTGRAMQVSNF